MKKRIRAVRNNLPVALSSFVGRERELAQLREMIARARLLTLTGAGGSGKTRLAVQAAASYVNDPSTRFPDGVWLVKLAPLNAPSLVGQTVAKVLNLVEQPNRTLLELLSDWLRDKQLLLVLDNCEHLIEPCARLAETLLEQCPHLTVLATSREALNIPGEQVWIVPPLPFPVQPASRAEGKAAMTLQGLEAYDAVRLFVERARAMDPSFELNARNAAAVADICRRVDGIPLGVELAAARMNVLSVEQIAARLDDALRILTEGNRTAPQRHQTLLATLNWSYDLLTPNEQVLFRRLAVFAGGFTLAAAEALCADEGLAQDDVLELLSRLVSKSLLLKREQEGESRYRLLEPVRQFAQRRLHDAGESERFHARHLAFFLALAEQVEQEPRHVQSTRWSARFEAEHDNFRTALEASQARAADSTLGLRLACALFWFWLDRGYYAEGWGWLDAARARTDWRGARAASSVETVLEAKALYALGSLRAALADHAAAIPLLEQSVALWRALVPRKPVRLAWALVTLGREWRDAGKPADVQNIVQEALTLFQNECVQEGIAAASFELGMALRDQENFIPARTRIEEGLAICRALGDQRGIGVAMRCLGRIAYRQGDYATAFERHQEGLGIQRVLGSPIGVAYAFLNLGIVTLCREEAARAARFFEQAANIFREVGDEQGILLTSDYDGHLALLRGDLTQAHAVYAKGLGPALRGVAPIWIRGHYLFGFAAVAAVQEQWELAARLYGAADRHMLIGASFWDAADRRLYERTIGRARAQLGAARFETARAAGAALTLEQAAAEMEQVRIPQAAALGAPDTWHGLTTRELQVLRLLAEGMSDAQIAAELVVSPRTVNTHLTTIYSKLGVNSRAMATRYALEQNLL